MRCVCDGFFSAGECWPESKAPLLIRCQLGDAYTTLIDERSRAIYDSEHAQTKNQYDEPGTHKSSQLLRTTWEKGQAKKGARARAQADVDSEAARDAESIRKQKAYDAKIRAEQIRARVQAEKEAAHKAEKLRKKNEYEATLLAGRKDKEERENRWNEIEKKFDDDLLEANRKLQLLESKRTTVESVAEHNAMHKVWEGHRLEQEDLVKMSKWKARMAELAKLRDVIDRLEDTKDSVWVEFWIVQAPQHDMQDEWNRRKANAKARKERADCTKAQSVNAEEQDKMRHLQGALKNLDINNMLEWVGSEG